MLKKLLIGAVSATVILSSSVFADTQKVNVCSAQCGVSVAQQMFVPRIVDAVSKTGISAAQTKKIADGIVAYKGLMIQIKQMQIFPVDSFMNDSFNETKFISEMGKKQMARIAAKATLFKYVFAVLNKEQRKLFKNAYAAHMIEGMIKANY